MRSHLCLVFFETESEVHTVYTTVVMTGCKRVNIVVRVDELTRAGSITSLSFGMMFSAGRVSLFLRVHLSRCTLFRVRVLKISVNSCTITGGATCFRRVSHLRRSR